MQFLKDRGGEMTEEPKQLAELSEQQKGWLCANGYHAYTKGYITHTNHNYSLQIFSKCCNCEHTLKFEYF